MPRRPSRIRWLRASLLGLFLLSLAAIVVLLRFGGSQELAPEPEPEEGPTPAAEVGDVELSSTDCERAVVVEETVLFELEAERCAVTRDERVALEGVVVRQNRNEGQYVIRSERGTFDEERREARFEGNVVVEGPRQLELYADWLELQHQGTVLVASEDSRFRILGSAEGTSRILRMNLEQEEILLQERVRVRSLPQAATPFSLDADLVRFVRDRRLIRAQGGVDLRQGGSRMQALRVSVYLNEVGDGIEFVRALWNVRGILHVANEADAEPVDGEDGGALLDGTTLEGPVEYEGMSFALERTQTGLNKAFELDGTLSDKVRLTSRGPDGVTRVVRAARIRGFFQNDRLSRAEAVGAVRFAEWPADGSAAEPSRTARGDSATTTFDDTGSVVSIGLEGQVEIEGDGVVARAERANVMVLQEITELFGDPRVQVTSSQGLLNAPRVVIKDRLGLLEAYDGVRARLDRDDALGASAALGGGDGPIFVEAEEALLQEEKDAFLFKGDVRTWRGKNLLLSEQLRGQREGNQLTATGSVRTVWYDESRATGPATGEDGEAAGPAGPTEVRAGFMDYSESEGRLLYEEEVTVRQEAGTMSCARLHLFLDDRQEIERMECDGGEARASLVDERVGRRITGDRMVFHPGADELEVFGDVEAKEGKRRFSGPCLLYDLETGSFSAGECGQSPEVEPPS